MHIMNSHMKLANLIPLNKHSPHTDHGVNIYLVHTASYMKPFSIHILHKVVNMVGN